MPTMAILDDRREQRDTLMRSIKTALPKDWDCIECPLLSHTAQYPHWLMGHKVDVLVADQVLNEQVADRTGTADYKGNEVTTSIRRAMPNFPIFIVTAFPGDSDLGRHMADVEAVVTRRELTSKVREYIPRMVRAGLRFNDEIAESLTKLSKAAAKVASGRATATDRKRLERMQIACGVISSAAIDGPREAMLSKVEEGLSDLEELRLKIERLLKERGKKKEPCSAADNRPLRVLVD